MGGPRAAAVEATPSDGPSAVTPEIAAEAAVWVARLHGPDRSRRMERECLAWQARSAAHREAFECCTETWLDVPRVTLAHAYASAASANAAQAAARSPWRLGVVRLAFGLAVVGMMAGGAALLQQWHGKDSHGTGVGEQQLLVLDDGTRMSLNTDTRVRVDLGATQRTVRLDGGEALFEVARDASRPFVVRAAGSEVVAVGTVFAVRFTAGDGGRADDPLAVTLIEGQVTVRPAQDGAAAGVAPARPIVMQPGERVRLATAAGSAARKATPQVDRPSIEQVVAWKRNEAVFNGAPLADAVAEMNRYSRTPIVLVGDAALGQRRVSGLYRTGDNAGFAHAVAALHGLRVHQRQGRLELAVPQ